MSDGVDPDAVGDFDCRTFLRLLFESFWANENGPVIGFGAKLLAVRADGLLVPVIDTHEDAAFVAHGDFGCHSAGS